MTAIAIWIKKLPVPGSRYALALLGLKNRTKSIKIIRGVILLIAKSKYFISPAYQIYAIKSN